jgi:hypothetical protein
VGGQNQYIQWIEWNGEQPSNGGGGLRFVQGTTNFTDQYNWWHGVNAPGAASGQSSAASLNYFDGGSSGTTTNNVIIEWNVYGSTSFGDCGTVMNTTDTTDNGNGGLCNGVGLHNNVTNITINNNIFHWLEQGMKFYEGQGEANPVTVDYNDYSHIVRIDYETQANIGSSSQPTLMYIQYDSWHDRYPNSVFQSYMISAANGCDSPTQGYSDTCETHTDYNVYVANVSNGQDVGIEIWGNCDSTGTPCTTANYNLIQGYNYNGITWAKAGAFIFDNNTFQMSCAGSTCGSNTSCTAHAGGYWNWDGSGPIYTPTCSGNTFSTTVSTVTSVAPTVSPTTSTVAPGTVVSISNLGANRDTNTSAWCTTDGTSPVPGSGTATIMTSYTVAASPSMQTLKCVGMWGQANQPYSYPSGYGYVPSSIISNTYTVSGGGGATAHPGTQVIIISANSPLSANAVIQ